MGNSSRTSLTMVAVSALVAVGLTPTSGHAADPSFSQYDIPTVFFINKSDDGSRVDYGMRLNAQCQPANNEPVFPYWREFDNPPVRTHGLKLVEYLAYGVSDQRIVRRTDDNAVVRIRMKQFDRPVIVVTSKTADGKCAATAYMTIASVQTAELASVFLKLGGFMSVDYAEIRGKDPKTGNPLVERVRH